MCLSVLLQALSISGAYPFASLSGMLFMLFVNIRECDERTMHAKLSLLLYYLLDLGHMQPEQACEFPLDLAKHANSITQIIITMIITICNVLMSFTSQL